MSNGPAATAAPPQTVVADPQDPLPESNWFWRRVFVGVICGTILALVWFYTDALAEVAKGRSDASNNAVDALESLLKLALYLLGLVIMLYLIAPSDGSTAEATTKAGMTGAKPAAPAADLPDYAKP
jgi:Na+/H+ antiporter NhaD/arsenite permease-like protein